MTVLRLLVVDDDVALVSVLVDALEEDGFHVTTAHDGKAGLAKFRAGSFDLVLLDVMMPELDGLSLCRKLRETSDVPVIFLTSRADDVDRITGLELGADDFVGKPFNTRELIARMRAVLRRTKRTAELSAGSAVAVGALTIDEARFLVTWRGKEVTLTSSEFKVLLALAKKPGFVLSRDQLIDAARGSDVVITERTIDTFIKRIRQKCAAVDEDFDAIETVIGVGYRFKGAP
jgi:two-component system response regulator ChvI